MYYLNLSASFCSFPDLLPACTVAPQYTQVASSEYTQHMHTTAKCPEYNLHSYTGLSLSVHVELLKLNRITFVVRTPKTQSKHVHTALYHWCHGVISKLGYVGNLQA